MQWQNRERVRDNVENRRGNGPSRAFNRGRGGYGLGQGFDQRGRGRGRGRGGDREQQPPLPGHSGTAPPNAGNWTRGGGGYRGSV